MLPALPAQGVKLLLKNLPEKPEAIVTNTSLALSRQHGSGQRGAKSSA